MAKNPTAAGANPASGKKTSAKVQGPGRMEKHALKIALALGVLALVVRLYRIGYLSLWVDEYMHALAAVKGQFRHGENNGILLTWLNTLSAYVFGHNEFAMRFPVAVLGAALVPATYVLGKRIANFRVGLMSAFFVAFSLYLIYWSRVDRPYGMVAAFYVPLLLSFFMMLNGKNDGQGFWSRFGIQPKYLWLTLIALLLSMLSQLICFLFIFSAGFYGTFMAVDSWISKRSNPIRLNAFNVLFYLNAIAVVLMLTPMGNRLMRPIIEIFLPGNMATLILPDLKAAIKAIGTDTLYKSFDVYNGVLSADFKGMAWLGWLGFVFSLIRHRQVAYFLISGFVVPFLLMSFVFREPVHAKYLSYIYPVFLISAAYSLYYLAFYLGRYLSKTFTEQSRSYLNLCTILFLVLLTGMSKRKEISAVLNTTEHGNLVEKSLSEIHFVNWKQPCVFIRENMQKNDVVMATVQFAPRFYLGLDSVVWFRQMHFDASKKEYVPNVPDNRRKSATTYEQLVKTFTENPRGWLLADYYFDNALTDPRAKQFVEQNFTYHFSACDDGGVKVFSWDKSKPKTYESSFVVELGKNDRQLGSMPMSMMINKAGLPPRLSLYFITQGIDSDIEAYVLINEKEFAIPPNGKAGEIGINVLEVDASAFKDGENKIQFAYNSAEDNGDLIRGCVIYNMEIR